MAEIWLRSAEITPHEPGFPKFTPKAPRVGIDTSVVIDAVERGDDAARKLLRAARDGKVEISVSLTLDEELERASTEARQKRERDELWPFVGKLPRTSRPSAVVGEARVGEMVVGDDGAYKTLRRASQGDKAREHSRRDEEHVSSAFSWGAVCFITRDREILSSKALARRGWRIVSPEEVLEQLDLLASAEASAR